METFLHKVLKGLEIVIAIVVLDCPFIILTQVGSTDFSVHRFFAYILFKSFYILSSISLLNAQERIKYF